jgi:hypothetical protein
LWKSLAWKVQRMFHFTLYKWTQSLQRSDASSNVFVHFLNRGHMFSLSLLTTPFTSLVILFVAFIYTQYHSHIYFGPKTRKKCKREWLCRRLPCEDRPTTQVPNKNKQVTPPFRVVLTNIKPHNITIWNKMS